MDTDYDDKILFLIRTNNHWFLILSSFWKIAKVLIIEQNNRVFITLTFLVLVNQMETCFGLRPVNSLISLLLRLSRVWIVNMFIYPVRHQLDLQPRECGSRHSGIAIRRSLYLEVITESEERNTAVIFKIFIIKIENISF